MQNKLSLPQTYDEPVPQNHLVWVINKVLDKIGQQPLLKLYKTGGSSTYHPGMPLTVLVYGHIKNMYSSRKIEVSLLENIYFRWLSSNIQLGHSIINRFRNEGLKDVLHKIFTLVVQSLAEEVFVNIKNNH